LREENTRESKARRVVRFISFAVGVVFSISLIRNALDFYRSGDRIDEASSKVSELEKVNQELRERLEEVQSQEYIERESRNKLGLAREGEIVVVLPDEEVLRKLAPPKREEEKDELPEPNWREWLDLFF